MEVAEVGSSNGLENRGAVERGQWFDAIIFRLYKIYECSITEMQQSPKLSDIGSNPITHV